LARASALARLCAPTTTAPPSLLGSILSTTSPSSRCVKANSLSPAQNSAVPDSAPLIDPGFLRDQRDLDRLEQGLRIVRAAAGSPAFAGVSTAEVWPGPEVATSAALRAYIRAKVGSYYHPVGTCRMGSDATAVVDAELRVRGVAGLRVADASVLPTITNAHPNATVLAIAERAADLIRATAR